jgi:DEAD/DEAH box helicase domain-containing protein
MRIADMLDIAKTLIESLNLEVLESIDLPGQPERRIPLPSALTKGPLAAVLPSITPDGTAWNHQSVALERLFARENIVVATGTASGKSLVFQLYAFHRILEDPQAKVLVFYPLKALAADQFARWRAMAVGFGVNAEQVVRIDGDMPSFERGDALDKARIVLMTPDVCQAWLMRAVGSALVRRFLENLVLLVLDEAHVYESVFGSNVAFLLRRMISAKRRATQKDNDQRRLQAIAATATIAEPADHLHRLTGLEFSVIDEDQNGAPSHFRQIIHVNGAEYGAAGEAALADLVRGIHALEERHRFIAFMDSRQGIERIVQQMGSDGILPYRSGYEAGDRKRIETALRDGSLDGVVATSALELGIDIADMEIGANLGVPQTRKAFRQRIGRVGRSCPGVFFVIAKPSAFKRFGETFKDYYSGSVEPSYLYLGNRFIQFAHARCLADEMEVLKSDQSGLPPGVSWPEGFAQILKYARPGGGRPREFDFIAQLGADAPHINYPLRQVGEANFDIKEGPAGHPGRVGNIATNQAIREAYPGANYLHLGRTYKVLEWSTRSFDRSIRVVTATNPVQTRALLRKSVTLSLGSDGIVENRIRRCASGLVTEVHLQVNESVEGYTIGSTSFLYRDLRAENPNMSRKQRDFRTTGVIVRIDEPWFAGTKGQNPHIREQVAKGLLGLISRDRSIAPQDVDATHSNIALITESGPRRLTDAIVIYDSVYGGLRLTEDLFVEFARYVEQLGKAADLAGVDAIVSEDTAKRLETWTKALGDGEVDPTIATPPPDGWYQIYRPGSVVSVLFNGNFVERELLEPKLADPFGTGKPTLFYSYRVSTGTASGFVPHDQVQATGQDWSWVYWNPGTGEYQELDQGEQLSASSDQAAE